MWAFIQAAHGICVLIAVQVLMAMRVYAMSGRNRYLIFGLGVYSAIEVIYLINVVTLKGNAGRCSSIPLLHVRLTDCIAAIIIPNIMLEAYHSE